MCMKTCGDCEFESRWEHEFFCRCYTWLFACKALGLFFCRTRFMLFPPVTVVGPRSLMMMMMMLLLLLHV